MPLSIKDLETEKLARRLAAETGESITEAIRVALRERLARELQQRAKLRLSDRLLGIGRLCAAHVKAPAHSLDHNKLLYDKNGLAK